MLIRLLYCDSLFSNVIHDRYQGNQFFMASDLPRFANYMGLSLRMQYRFDNPTRGTYSVFDSHSSDVTGNPTPEGATALLTFDLIEDLSQYLLRLYPNILLHFNLHIS